MPKPYIERQNEKWHSLLRLSVLINSTKLSSDNVELRSHTLFSEPSLVASLCQHNRFCLTMDVFWMLSVILGSYPQHICTMYVLMFRTFFLLKKISAWNMPLCDLIFIYISKYKFALYVSRAHDIEIRPSSVVCVATTSEPNAWASFRFWLLLPRSIRSGVCEFLKKQFWGIFFANIFRFR